MNTSKTFARSSRAFIIAVHFFPVLRKFATRNDHFSGNKENVNTEARIWIFFPSLDIAPIKFSSRVAPLAFKSYTHWDNDEKDWQTWTCNYKRRSPYRRVVDLKLPNKTQESAHMKLVETEQDTPENISIPIKGHSLDKFFTIQNDKQKGGIILSLTINKPSILCLKRCRAVFFRDSRW